MLELILLCLVCVIAQNGSMSSLQHCNPLLFAVRQHNGMGKIGHV